MSKVIKQPPGYVFVLLNEDLKDQRDLLKDAQDEEHEKEIEARIAELIKWIKIVKEHKEKK